jgi:hypothetical protein
MSIFSFLIIRQRGRQVNLFGGSNSWHSVANNQRLRGGAPE